MEDLTGQKEATRTEGLRNNGHLRVEFFLCTYFSCPTIAHLLILFLWAQHHGGKEVDEQQCYHTVITTTGWVTYSMNQHCSLKTVRQNRVSTESKVNQAKSNAVSKIPTWSTAFHSKRDNMVDTNAWIIDITHFYYHWFYFIVLFKFYS